jgi:hypothetical protein
VVVPRRQQQRWRPAPHKRGVPARNASRGAVAYDYAAKFQLTGRPGNIVQDVINISAEGVFVATAIGYGLEEDRGRAINLRVRQQPGQPEGFILPGDITLGEIPPLALIEGFRVNARFDSMLFASSVSGATQSTSGERRERRFADQLAPTAVLNDAFERVKSPEDISFLFSVVDSGSGRELQDEPTLNLASLGKSNGERPFRLLARPLFFLPRSTVRIQIVERSQDVAGTLFIVLYGYKLLAASDCSEEVVRSLAEQPDASQVTLVAPQERVIPFDYVAAVDLTGQSGNLVEDELTINAEGGFVATSLGYGLAVGDFGVRIVRPGDVHGRVTEAGGIAISGATVQLRNVATGAIQRADTDIRGDYRVALAPGQWELSLASPFAVGPLTVNVTSGTSITVNLNPATAPVLTRGEPPVTIDLRRVPLRLLPPDALVDGIRVRPDFVRIAFEDNGRLATTMPIELVDHMFERLNRPDDLSFRYSIFDGGRGLELQNRPINNVAGLGIANGDRPFKAFARPMIFGPRSTIRVSVEEHSGRGRLYFAFQGYKVLSAASAGK